MSEYQVALPSKPLIVSEEEFSGSYEIDGLYPGYGHTLGNSLRRIILSSLPGAAITSIKIDGISHEFSTLQGVKEDVITLLLNLKKVRLEMHTDTPQTLTLSVKGPKTVTAGDIETPGQVTVLNPTAQIAEVTDKSGKLFCTMTVERGLGFVPKEALQKDKVDIGTIALDAIFTPIRRVNYEVENMRVGDRTDFNRLKIFIETDGTITPRAALEKSIETMINQLKAIIGFKEEEISLPAPAGEEKSEPKKADAEFLKTRVESLELSARIATALSGANIRTVGGLVRKSEEDLLEVDGLGAKAVQEIKRILTEHGVALK